MHRVLIHQDLVLKVGPVNKRCVHVYVLGFRVQGLGLGMMMKEIMIFKNLQHNIKAFMSVVSCPCHVPRLACMHTLIIRGKWADLRKNHGVQLGFKPRSSEYRSDSRTTELGKLDCGHYFQSLGLGHPRPSSTTALLTHLHHLCM